MAWFPNDRRAPQDSSLNNNVAVGTVVRYDLPWGETNLLDLGSALALSLRSAGLLSPAPRNASYVLNAEILSHSQAGTDEPQITTRVRYELFRQNPLSSYLTEEITTQAVATRSDAADRASREEIAQATAVRNNIRALVDRLLAQPSAPATAPYAVPAPSPFPSQPAAPSIIDPSAAVS